MAKNAAVRRRSPRQGSESSTGRTHAGLGAARRAGPVSNQRARSVTSRRQGVEARTRPGRSSGRAGGIGELHPRAHRWAGDPHASRSASSRAPTTSMRRRVAALQEHGPRSGRRPPSRSVADAIVDLDACWVPPRTTVVASPLLGTAVHGGRASHSAAMPRSRQASAGRGPRPTARTPVPPQRHSDREMPTTQPTAAGLALARASRGGRGSPWLRRRTVGSRVRRSWQAPQRAVGHTMASPQGPGHGPLSGDRAGGHRASFEEALSGATYLRTPAKRRTVYDPTSTPSPWRPRHLGQPRSPGTDGRVWRDEGCDEHPVAEGTERDAFVEHYELEPIDRQERRAAALLRHCATTSTSRKPGETETFHDQVGYWLWSRLPIRDLHAWDTPRQVLLAAGPASPTPPSSSSTQRWARRSTGSSPTLPRPGFDAQLRISGPARDGRIV